MEGTSQVTLSVIGEKMGFAAHSGLHDIEKMVLLPKGCGEQNMMRLAPLVFIAEYRKHLGQLEPTQETKIKHNMMIGECPIGHFHSVSLPLASSPLASRSFPTR